MAGINILQSVVLTSPASSVTLSDIPDTYAHLMVKFYVASTWGGGFYDSYDALYFRFNSIATNYNTIFYDDHFAYGAGGQGSFKVTNVPHANFTYAFSGGELLISQYANSNVGSFVQAHSGAVGRNLQSQNQVTATRYTTSQLATRQVVTSINFFVGQANIATGSRFDLYGLQA